MVNLVNLFRKKIKVAEHNFYAGKIGGSSDALILANVSFLLAIYIALFWLLAFIIAPINETLSLIVCGTLSVCVLLFCRIQALFSLTLPISAKILFNLYGKYGYCVSKKDWTTIKKKSPYVYKFLNSKKSKGTCYLSSWLIALHLKGAEIMYLGYGDSKDTLTAHAVVVRGNVVYDTNARMHSNIFEYLEFSNAKVFKIYNEKQYRKKSFFDDIRNEFVTWCQENNITCNF